MLTSEQRTQNDKPLLEIRNLKTYFHTDDGVVRAVDGVDLSLNRQQTLGVVGESGCGKSITAFSVMRLIPSPPGEIVDGEIIYRGMSGLGNEVDLTQLHPRGPEIRNIRGNEIAMIFQEPMTSLSPVHTVGNQISEAIRLHQKVRGKEARNRTIEMLRKVRLPKPDRQVDAYPHELSGGMRQRAMIAMALSCNPNLLIADEPTTALDVTVQAQVLDLLRDLQKEIQMSIMLITHDLGVIAQMADQVAVMYMGKIVEYTDVVSLFRRPLHPYTLGLLNSIPKIGQKKKLEPIIGSVPDPYTVLKGCSFAPRCPFAHERCLLVPPLSEVVSGHQVACWKEIPESHGREVIPAGSDKVGKDIARGRSE